MKRLLAKKPLPKKPRVKTISQIGRILVLAAALCIAPTAIHAQDADFSHLDRGRTFLDANDVRAVAELRAAAQESLTALSSALTTAAATVAHPDDVQAAKDAASAVHQARENAATAHFWWGMAADHFARRDEAITALARSVDLANVAAAGPPAEVQGEITALQRDAASALANILRAGLPFIAADDALDIIAAQTHGGMWKPSRSTFTIPASLLQVSSHAVAATTGAAIKNPALSAEFLVTVGKLFPAEQAPSRAGESRLTRIPPLYADVPSESLPASLRMDRTVTGYTRETSGSNRGLWRQTVRVFYASPYTTRNQRDDEPRAEALCLQFLRVAATVRAGLGLANPYTSDGVTTLWLNEVSVQWPDDDDDPAVVAQLPPKMPTPNTPLKAGVPLAREVAVNPLSRTWQAAATLDSAPGDILFFKVGQPRSEFGWLRQLMHEYGHVALPPFDRFAPPLEPYGNGIMGETLQALWAAQNPRAWLNQGSDSADDTGNTAEFGRALVDFTNALNSHIESNAVPGLALWKKNGPSPLRFDRTRVGLAYLNGLAVAIDRTYGAPFLGKSLAPLLRRPPQNGIVNRMPTLTADALLNSVGAQRDVWNGGSEIPVWLGGVLDVKIATGDLVRRAPLVLRDATASGWVWVPPYCEWLKIAWRGDGSLRAAGGWKQAGLSVEGAVKTLRITAPAGTLQTRGSWQKIALAASGNVTITDAQFERHLE